MYMAPSNESISAVKDWLSAHDIVTNALYGHGDWLGFSTTVEKASELFDAKFMNFKHIETRKVQVRTMAYSIPANLTSHIDLIYPMIS
jgi:tripeptidyl-peptidase-1